jgi:Fe-S-cluster containining protein
MKSRQTNFFSICNTCKLCCCQNARPPITQNRRKQIEEYLLTQDLKVYKPFETTEYVFPRETRDGFCVFFDEETRRCQVYGVKPETCVAGPITFDINLQTGKIEFYLKFERICPLAGTLKKDVVALEKHVNSAKRELLTLVGELDAEALSAILQIDEPETWKIGEALLSKVVLERLRNQRARRKGSVHIGK